MKLEDEADAGQPDFRALILGHGGRRASVNQNFADSWEIKQPQEVQQGRFA